MVIMQPEKFAKEILCCTASPNPSLFYDLAWFWQLCVQSYKKAKAFELYYTIQPVAQKIDVLKNIVAKRKALNILHRNITSVQTGMEQAIKY